MPHHSVLDLNGIITIFQRDLFCIKREYNRYSLIGIALKRLCVVPCRSILDLDGLVF